MSEIDELRKQIAREKAKADAYARGRTIATTKAEREAALRKELNALKRQNNPVVRKLKPLYTEVKTTFGNVVNNIERDYGGQFDQLINNVANDVELGAATSTGFSVGTSVIIKNGPYTGRVMKIKRFIPGGVSGVLNGMTINIRHGSYARK